MRKSLINWRAVLLGAVIGVIFGGFCEIANRIEFWREEQELERIAAAGGPIIDIAYTLKWWALPCFFSLLFALISLLVHGVRRNRPTSLFRIWEEVGLLAAAVCVVPTIVYGVLKGLPFTGEIIGSCGFLFVLAFILGLVFAGFLRIVRNYATSSEEEYSQRAG